MSNWFASLGNIQLDPYDPHPMPPKPYTLVKYKYRLDMPNSFDLAGVGYELREEVTSYRVYVGDVIKFILSKEDIEYCALVEIK